MKSISKEVKLKKQVVGTIDIPQYDNIDEARAEINDDALMLALINRTIITDATNAERAKHRETTPGKKKRYELGFNLLPTVQFDDGETGMDKLVACAGDMAKLTELLASPEVEAAVTAKLGPAE